MPSCNLSFFRQAQFVLFGLVALSAILFLAACGESPIRTTVSAEDNKKVENAASSMKPDYDQLQENNFYLAAEEVLKQRGIKLESLYNHEDSLERRILEDYGAVFLANEKVLPPPVCIFSNAEQVIEFQTKATAASLAMSGATIELQPAAAAALAEARNEAQTKKLDISPRDGAEAARRSFDDTIRLWNSRFLPALVHWQKLGRLTLLQTEELKSLPIREQVSAVLELEKSGIFFNTFFNNSILYSVAAPGASQHLSMLAFDANEFADKRVRKILANHGWFRTVRGDAPHFTFLGVSEDVLPRMGLKKAETGDGEFWIPNV